MTQSRTYKINFIRAVGLLAVVLGSLFLYSLSKIDDVADKYESELFKINSNIKNNRAEKAKYQSYKNDLEQEFRQKTTHTIMKENLKKRLSYILSHIEKLTYNEESKENSLSITVDQIANVKNDKGEEYINLVDIRLKIKNLSPYETNPIAMLKVKKMLKIQKIRDSLKPYMVNGKYFNFKDKYIVFRRIKS